MTLRYRRYSRTPNLKTRCSAHGTRTMSTPN
ncbi:hypothetical protein F444_20497 [Phytophthora nicotianae P1976]|uniref:Uncharacterized protein n=1 Tax=Phytophthora nicotianae P1976 TaxID=1317066 RepID=A0A080Z4E4_PHYNI|nr:hypothetical protein F444_20497 [Phytophthora nicotianae P1976]